MRRWGQIAEQKPNDWYFEIAKKVYRPDLYETAADFPDFAQEDGFRDPQTEFIDGVTFDGSKPKVGHYLR